MNILLTAANSFIGRNLGAYLHGKGHLITATVRRDKSDSFKPPWLSRSFAWDIRNPEQADASIFNGVNSVVHLAHDFGPGMVEANIEATGFLSEKASKAGVEKQIFLSSYSARPDAVSDYGIIKYRLERYFLERGHVIVRPGLVIGNGGMFLRFFKAVRKYPVIPLINGGRGETPVISIGQLCEVVDGIISSPVSETQFNAFYPEMPTMRTLVETMKQVAGRKTMLVPVPPGLVLFAASLCSLLGITPPFDAGSVKNFRKNQERIHHSNIAGFLRSYDSLLDAVEAALP